MKIKRIYGLFLLLLVLTGQSILAQGGFKEENERIRLFTDRTLYITGEKISFSAMVNDPDTPSAQVLYCELVTPEGVRAAGGKYPLENKISTGCLEIPREAVSGTYYLKAYTKEMRNSGPADYHYTRLIVINPVKEEILNSSPVEGLEMDASEPVPEITDGPFRVLADADRYGRRQPVRVSILQDPGATDPVDLLCLSVVPESSYARYPASVPEVGPNGAANLYHPETRGISMTGKLVDELSGAPLQGVKVNLSVLGDKDFMAMRTDSSGRFYFTLPDHTGAKDIFLCSEQVEGAKPGIRVDNDYCTRKMELPATGFRLPPDVQVLALQMAQNLLVKSLFSGIPDTGTLDSAVNGRPFYGEPSQVLILDNYIDLPTLEEYFNELPMGVKVRKQQGKKYFRFFSEQTEMVIYDPLVLIDWVAVDDVDKILALSPRDISRIELVEEPYIKGRIIYGGIISFISRKNDFAGIDLPSSGTFINFDFYNDCSSIENIVPLPEDMPDGRNTVYWDPKVVPADAGQTDVPFHTPDTPGSYLILLRGIDRNGKEISASARIVVL